MPELTFIQNLAAMALPLLLGITLHEVAHGYAALHCGDKTGQLAGRLSLNPWHHVDLLGTILLPLICLSLGGFIFGWAKPMPINSRFFKHWRRDMVLVALAGPAANLGLALAFALAIKLGVSLSTEPRGIAYALQVMGEYGILLNLFLCFFNLIPIPPLDGGRAMLGLLPPHLAYRYQNLERYGFWLVLFLFFLGLGRWLALPIESVRIFILQLVGL